VAAKESVVGLAPIVGGTVAAVTVKVTGTLTGEAPVALSVIMPLCVPAVSVPVAAVSMTLPFPVPLVVARVNQGALSLAVQARVPPPVLLMLNICTMGLPLPCWAVKEKLAGLAAIVGLAGASGAAGGVINCANPGISAANLLIDRPPVLPLPDDEELPAPAAATGMVPVCGVPAAMEPVAVAGDGAALMVARGIAAPTLLLSDDDSLD
jgi:hypothetical protein